MERAGHRDLPGNRTRRGAGSCFGRRPSAATLASLCAITGGLLFSAAPALADIAPTVAIKPPSAVAYTTATLSGTVNPNAGPSTTSWHFEYSPSSEESWTPLAASAFTAAQSKENAPLPVTSTLEGLQPNISYQVRLIATNAGGETISAEPNPTFTSKAVIQPAVTIAAPSAVTATTAHFAGTVKPNGTDPAFNTAWHFECTPECPGLEGGELPADNAVHEVTADTTGLLAHTVYMVVLVASNLGGQETAGPETFTTLAAVPAVEEEFLSEAAASSATFSAKVNPEGAPTSYTFEYAPLGGPFSPVGEAQGKGSIPEGTAGVLLSVHVQHGLLPHTTYQFRVVATNAVQTVIGEPVLFTTQALGGELLLPDAREWEMVSPPDKHGANLLPIEEVGTIQAAAVGNAVSFPANAATEAEPQGSSNAVQLLSRRGPTGWASEDIAIAHDAATGHSTGRGYEYRFFSSDLSLGIVQPFGGFMAALSGEASEQTAYLRTNYLNRDVTQACSGACYLPLVTGKPGYSNVPLGTVFGNSPQTGEPCPPGLLCGPEFVSATPDLSHVILYSKVALTKGSSGGLYEWAAGRLTFIGLPLTNTQESVLAVSNDGSRVVFTGTSEGLAGLLVRDIAKGKTVRPDEAVGGEGQFWGASGDASKVFFTDAGHLYEYDMSTAKPIDLAPEGGVAGVAGVSKDGSYVYFVTEVTGTCALYVLHGGPPKLVTALSCNDARGDWEPRASEHSARVSPNGEWLAFMSQAKLKGYDNRDALSGVPDEEVYLYHASSGVLVCASCNGTGARPRGVEYRHISSGEGGIAGGDEAWPAETWIAANVPPWTPYRLATALYQSRYLSNSGRLFFNSSDALVPQDVNGREDVYQFEPSGIGGCGSASLTFSDRLGGCVDLISSGTAGESAFLDASESGNDVFFLTSAKLSPQDFDTSLDVYDAHACTSAAACFPPVVSEPPACSTGDSCKASPTPQPDIFGAPASVTFSGPGNPAPPVSTSVRTLTKAQKLAKALAVCRQKYKRATRRRGACEHQARRRFGAKKKPTTAGKATTKRTGSR